MARLHDEYKEKHTKAMQEKFGIKNVMDIPKLDKIVINMGVGAAIGDMKILDSAVADLTKITGQKPVVTRAKIAVSNFKLREGMPIGCKVTLRRATMYEFMDRLINFCLPRIRDFNGVSRKAFDRQGNYTLGISDQSIFPEIDAGRIQYQQGMDITFVFNKGPQEYTMELLRLFGMPFVKPRKPQEQLA
ncbi:MAG: 50S ribosomal protein L5 [Candidatus Omnitrophica bacterium]|nr:50S ribosomal protein L5 [Candidatus Omnitrophota bacterium]